MNLQELTQVVDETVLTLRGLLNVKGQEYAGGKEVDRLANFKRGAALVEAIPLQILLIYLAKHYDSFANYVKREAKGEAHPQGVEDIEGRLNDIIAYCVLAKALIQEQANASRGLVARRDRIEDAE